MTEQTDAAAATAIAPSPSPSPIRATDYFDKRIESVRQQGDADSAQSTPSVGTPASASGAATPTGSTASELSDSEQMVATSTLTTTITRGTGSGEAEVSTAKITHVGAKGITAQVGKDGAVRLRPQPASTSRRKRIRAIVSFKPRHSHFNRENSSSSTDQFRGFFTLFWISIGLFVLNTSYTSFADTGKVLSMTFATLFSRDARMLALSDAVLIASTFICVPFIKVCKRGWVRYWPTAVVFQHLWQSALLFAVIKWARYREWPWVQSGFFVLHTLSMMMKIHSYMAVNGNMADAYHRMLRLGRMLEERVAEVEGGEAGQGEEQLHAAWNRAVRRARTNAGFDADGDAGAEGESEKKGKQDGEPCSGGDMVWASLELQRGSSGKRLRRRPAAAASSDATATSDPSQPKPELSKEEHKKLHAQAHDQETQRRRRTSSSAKRSTEAVAATAAAAGAAASKEAAGCDGHAIRDPHPLATHPDSLVSDLAREIEVLREDLLSAKAPEVTEPGIIRQDTVVWPDNVTYANFWDYLLVPTLVYELSYPRTTTIRPLYVLEKILATFGTFLVIYVITEHWIMPNSPSPDTPLLRTFLQLAVPMMVNYLLIFYLIFEGVLGGFAEITRFADREFYQDWWNATSMDVFSRKWNKPVHSFLLRHVYASTIAAWGLSRTSAMFVTFLFSSLVHELVMAIVSGKIRLYLFSAQMSQLPLILVSQIPFVKRNEALGNMIFWIGLMMGFPLLNIGYLVY
ncbi:related to acyl-CoA sterol acyltransferase [Pseudozyma flocculosa]|uniref:Related to acyl-CoA sterol acyltransferase n=1 Tax=Pseudozyma flocculosa TaxID=84751 RepID=A0A5C3FB50_9BASI|nr:related to acyl-CoA sterol acyltransferase [Pseudozyma flocculosa]